MSFTAHVRRLHQEMPSARGGTPEGAPTIMLRSADARTAQLVTLCANAAGCAVVDHTVDPRHRSHDALAALTVLGVPEARHLAATRGSCAGCVIVTHQPADAADFAAALAVGASDLIDCSAGPEPLLAAIEQGVQRRSAPATIVVRPAHAGAPAAGVAAAVARTAKATLVDVDCYEADLSCELWSVLGPGTRWGDGPAAHLDADSRTTVTLPLLGGVPILAFPNVPHAACPSPVPEIWCDVSAGVDHVVASAGGGHDLALSIPPHLEVVVCENHIGAVHHAARFGGIAPHCVLLVMEHSRGDMCAADVAAALGAQRWRRWGAPVSPRDALLTRVRRTWRTTGAALWKEATRSGTATPGTTGGAAHGGTRLGEVAA